MEKLPIVIIGKKRGERNLKLDLSSILNDLIMGSVRILLLKGVHEKPNLSGNCRCFPGTKFRKNQSVGGPLFFSIFERLIFSELHLKQKRKTGFLAHPKEIVFLA